MKLHEYIKILQTYDPNLDVAIQRYSEYELVDKDYIEIKDLYDNGGYLSRVYRDDDKLKAKKALVIAQGN